MRRRFRRPLRRGILRRVPPLLRRSNELFESGDYAQAASNLGQMARAAESGGGQRAPALYVRAGRAALLAGDSSSALELLERGLGLLAARGNKRKLSVVSRHVLGELEARGLRDDASRLTEYLKGLTPSLDPPMPITDPHPRAPLPRHCPDCGAPIRPDEVEWLDELTAECEFCGNPVRGE